MFESARYLPYPLVGSRKILFPRLETDFPVFADGNSGFSSSRKDFRWLGYLSIALSTILMIFIAVFVPICLFELSKTCKNVEINFQLFKAKSNSLWSQIQKNKRHLSKRSLDFLLPKGFVPFPFQKFRIVARPPSAMPIHRVDDSEKPKNLLQKDEQDMKVVPSLTPEDKKVLNQVMVQIESMADFLSELKNDGIAESSEIVFDPNSDDETSLSGNVDDDDDHFLDLTLEKLKQRKKDLESVFILSDDEFVNSGAGLDGNFHNLDKNVKDSEKQKFFSVNQMPSFENLPSQYASHSASMGSMPSIDPIVFDISEDQFAEKCIGLIGEPGHDGFDGEDGIPGPDGLPGIDVDDSDDNCQVCPLGPQGLPGPPGLLGPPGPKGHSGPPGLVGSIGVPSMIQGSPGPPGIPGPNGKQGKPGPKGENVISGIGQPGPAGLLGEPGIQGLDGEPGFEAKPSYGRSGRRGPPGEDGKDAIPGTSGLDGEQGEPGIDATYCPCPQKNMIQFFQ